MNTGKTIFTQVMDFIPWYEFQKCVDRYSGNYKSRMFTCQDQFLCMAFAQLTFRESLRDIEACLRSMQSKLYHMGIRGKVSRTTLARANENRDWRIYADFAQVLIHSARDLYSNDDFGLDLKETVYALDARTIDLCLSLFPWAKFRTTKGTLSTDASDPAILPAGSPLMLSSKPIACPIGVARITCCVSKLCGTPDALQATR